MNRILSPGWYVVIAIVALIVTWKTGRNSGKRSANEPRDKMISDDLKAIQETKRKAVKRDFNDVESLIAEVNETEESKESPK